LAGELAPELAAKRVGEVETAGHFQAMQTTETKRVDFPARVYTAAKVSEITGVSQFAVAEACRNGDIPGAYRKSLRGSSPWLIPGEAAQKWFDVMRGIVRDDLKRGAA
jgi:hypothetical protein